MMDSYSNACLLKMVEILLAISNFKIIFFTNENQEYRLSVIQMRPDVKSKNGK